MTPQRSLNRYAQIARVFDEAFRIPGTPWRFGLDAILGLVPGVGDLIAALAGVYGVLLARELDAPASVQVRMIGNLLLDTAVGSVPLIGDVFDVAFKAHVRNRVVLEQWIEHPRETRRTSRALLLLAALALVALVGTLVALAILGVRALLRLAG